MTTKKEEKKRNGMEFTYGKAGIVQCGWVVYKIKTKAGYITVGIMKGCSSKKGGINANAKVIDHDLWIVRAANNLGIVELQSKHPRRKMQ
jgi:hypothetical protein